MVGEPKAIASAARRAAVATQSHPVGIHSGRPEARGLAHRPNPSPCLQDALRLVAVELVVLRELPFGETEESMPFGARCNHVQCNHVRYHLGRPCHGETEESMPCEEEEQCMLGAMRARGEHAVRRGGAEMARHSLNEASQCTVSRACESTALRQHRWPNNTQL